MRLIIISIGAALVLAAIFDGLLDSGTSLNEGVDLRGAGSPVADRAGGASGAPDLARLTPPAPAPLPSPPLPSGSVPSLDPASGKLAPDDLATEPRPMTPDMRAALARDLLGVGSADKRVQVQVVEPGPHVTLPPAKPSPSATDPLAPPPPLAVADAASSAGVRETLGVTPQLGAPTRPEAAPVPGSSAVQPEPMAAVLPATPPPSPFAGAIDPDASFGAVPPKRPTAAPDPDLGEAPLPSAKPTAIEKPLEKPARMAAPLPDGKAPPTADVIEAQTLLALLGYNPGGTDGVAGPRTQAAVRAFQRDHGLRVDGHIDEPLFAKLEAAARNKRATVERKKPSDTTLANLSTGSGEQKPNMLVGMLGAIQRALGQEFDSVRRPGDLRKHCRAVPDTWVYDEASRGLIFCGEVNAIASGSAKR
jgi:hypothetical protein